MPWKKILVPVKGTSVDPDVVRLAITIGHRSKSEITAIHVIEVRWNLPLDAQLDEELDRGEELLADASRVAEQSGGAMKTELLQAREAAAAIVDTARSQQTDLILLGMPYRTRLGKVYVGRTVQDVYVTAPCAVLAYREPQPS
ncbi:MAG: universal stress protein [Candidatus Limnocylindria bacterium]